MQEHKTNLKMNIEKDHLIFWRRLSKRLKDLVKREETEEMKNKWLQRNSAKKPVTNKRTKPNQPEVGDPSESRLCQRVR